jgi:hypothetical protein
MNMESAIQTYLDAICDSYVKFIRKGSGLSLVEVNVQDDMINEFKSRIRFDVGKKYVKVIMGCGHQESVHSFVVREDGPKFKKGDILKAASWKAPATNFKRGSVFEDVSKSANWTGA